MPLRAKQPTEIALRRFAMLANRSSLHPRDWERFYAFVSVAARYRVGWDHHVVARRLIGSGFNEELARELGEIYWHCRCLLFTRGRHYNVGKCDYGRWLGKQGVPLA